jgi:hypothetical protein
MKAVDVFTPGGHPTFTYVDDHLHKPRAQLLDALESRSTLVSISGPSKSGKTVFVEQTIGRDRLVHVTGAAVQAASDVWLKVFDVLGTPVPQSRSKTKTISGSMSASAEAGGTVLVAKAKAGVSGSATLESAAEATDQTAVDLLQLLIKELRETDFVVFIDDFHYVPRAIQAELAVQIKEAIRQGVRMITAAVPYHADDVIRGNPDLRGRVFAIDFDYWDLEMLEKIAYKGFDRLNVAYRQPMVRRLATEAAGSPQLMQYLCLTSCRQVGARERPEKPVDLQNDDTLFDTICRETVPATDYSSVVEKMKEGPKIRGSERTIHATKKGWQGDVYKLLVAAIALDPPMLTLRYADLVGRMGIISTGDPPSGSSVTGACLHAAAIVNDFVGQHIIEWDEANDVLDIQDPYFLFYLRWSGAAEG